MAHADIYMKPSNRDVGVRYC